MEFMGAYENRAWIFWPGELLHHEVVYGSAYRGSSPPRISTGRHRGTIFLSFSRDT